MTKEQYDYQIDFDAGGSLARRRTQLLTDGCYLFEDELEFEAVLTTTIITCAAWLVELYELRAGEVFFLTDTNEVRPRTKSFGVVYLPFSITQPSFNNPRGRDRCCRNGTTSLRVCGDTNDLRNKKRRLDPTGMTQVFEILRSGSNLQSIDPHSRASFLSRKAKSLIDENYQFYPSIARIATRLGVSHAHLSRQFKRDYGMTPSDYFRKLRVADVFASAGARRRDNSTSHTMSAITT